jgi:hypothetical protein
MSPLILKAIRAKVVAHVVASLAALTLLSSCASSDVMTWDEYKNVKHRTPFILEFQSPKGHLLYFGAAHTNDPKHLQFVQLPACWEKFNPEIALLEGGVPKLPSDADASSAIAQSGELGLVAFLSRQSNTKAAPLESSIDVQAAALAKTYSKSEIKMYLTLRQLQQVKRENNPAIAGDWNGWANWWLGPMGFFNFVPSVKDVPPHNANELNAMARAHFPMLNAWHEIGDDQFDPRFSTSITQRITRSLSEHRESEMIQTILKEAAGGKRVFVVAGASHTVVQEKALANVLGKPIRRSCSM